MTASLTMALRPWLEIWIRPRATIRALLDAPPRVWVWVLPILSGITQSLVQAQSNGVGARASATVILALAVPIGAAWGIIQLFVLAASVYLVARWGGSTATFAQIRTVIAWAAVPQVALLVCWLTGTALWGRLLFLNPEIATSMGGPLFALGVLVISLATVTGVIWSFVIMVKGVAEARGGSAWQAFGNIIVAALMVGVAAMLLVAVSIPFIR